MLTRSSRSENRESIQIRGVVERLLNVTHRTRSNQTGSGDFGPKHSRRSDFSLFSMGWRFEIAFLLPSVLLSMSLHIHSTYPMLAYQVKGDSYEKSTRKYFNLDSIARIMFATNFSYFLRIFFEVLCSREWCELYGSGYFKYLKVFLSKPVFGCGEGLNEFQTTLL